MARRIEPTIIKAYGCLEILYYTTGSRPRVVISYAGAMHSSWSTVRSCFEKLVGPKTWSVFKGLKGVEGGELSYVWSKTVSLKEWLTVFKVPEKSPLWVTKETGKGIERKTATIRMLPAEAGAIFVEVRHSSAWGHGEASITLSVAELKALIKRVERERK